MASLLVQAKVTGTGLLVASCVTSPDKTLPSFYTLQIMTVHERLILPELLNHTLMAIGRFGTTKVFFHRRIGPMPKSTSAIGEEETQTIFLSLTVSL